MPRTESAADRAYGAIHQLIMSREFEIGEPISEYRVSERLELSRTPVREALKRLEQRGLLESFPGRGMFVRRYTIKDVIEITEVMREVECVAIRKMIANPVQKDIDRLHEIVTEQASAFERGDLDKALSDGRAFHNLISARVDNSRLHAAVADAGEQSDYLSRLEVQTSQGNEITAAAVDEHRQLVELLAKGDGEGAEVLLREHLSTHEGELLLLASAGVL